MDCRYLPIENKDSVCNKVHSELLFAAKAMGEITQQMCEKNSWGHSVPCTECQWQVVTLQLPQVHQCLRFFFYDGRYKISRYRPKSDLDACRERRGNGRHNERR